MLDVVCKAGRLVVGKKLQGETDQVFGVGVMRAAGIDQAQWEGAQAAHGWTASLKASSAPRSVDVTEATGSPAISAISV